MKRSLFLLLLAASLLLAACQTAQTPTQAPTAGVNPAPTKVNNSIPAITAGDGTNNPAEGGYPAGDAYPVDGQSDQSSAQPGPGSAFPPAPGDDAMQKANFLVDSASLTPTLGAPGQFDVIVEGSLPTPCNQLRAKVNEPNAQKQIVIEVYSVLEKDKMCTQVIKPFTGRVATLGNLPAGKYTVLVNETPAGEMSIP